MKAKVFSPSELVSRKIEGPGKEELELMLKSIPTVEKVSTTVQSETKKVPQAVKEYVKKMNDVFEALNETIKELTDKIGLCECADMIQHYAAFKRDFRWKLNDYINYPSSAITRDKEDDNNEYNQSRVTK